MMNKVQISAMNTIISEYKNGIISHQAATFKLAKILCCTMKWQNAMNSADRKLSLIDMGQEK